MSSQRSLGVWRAIWEMMRIQRERFGSILLHSFVPCEARGGTACDATSSDFWLAIVAALVIYIPVS